MKTDDIVRQLKQHHILGQASSEHLSRLAGESKMRTLQSGQLITPPAETSDWLPLVLEGKVEILLENPSGKEHIICQLQPRQCSGFCPLFYGTRTPAIARAVTTVRTLLLPKAAFNTVLAADSRLAHLYLTFAVSRYQLHLGLLGSLAFSSVSERLASVLWRLAEQEQPASSPCDRVEIKSVTHETLAKMVGTAREVVSRTLRDFEQQGAVEQRGRGRLSVDRNQLDRLVPRHERMIQMHPDPASMEGGLYHDVPKNADR